MCPSSTEFLAVGKQRAQHVQNDRVFEIKVPNKNCLCGLGGGFGGVGWPVFVARGVWPLFVLCGVLAFGVNWIVFVPSYLAQTEHYFDLTGSLTYLALILFAVVMNPVGDPRSFLLAGLVLLWAVRLGTFLFRRVKADGSDGRFDQLKPHFPTFLMVWTLQGLWVFLTLACVLAAMTSAESVPLGSFAVLGVLVFLFGWAIEVMADGQKRTFRSLPENRDRFIDTGPVSYTHLTLPTKA